MEGFRCNGSQNLWDDWGKNPKRSNNNLLENLVKKLQLSGPLKVLLAPLEGLE